MKSWIIAGMLALAVGVAPSMAAADAFEVSPGAEDDINVTADSSTGWAPTLDQRKHAMKVVREYLDAIEHSHYSRAYAMEAAVVRRDLSLDQFTQDAQKFRALAGPLKFWRAFKVTWTKDSPRAPFPGIYAVVDLVGQFAKVDRDCGYMVLYQTDAAEEFTIMRRENNFLDNKTAREIEKTKSKAEVAKVWSELSGHCPNYVAPQEFE